MTKFGPLTVVNDGQELWAHETKTLAEALVKLKWEVRNGWLIEPKPKPKRGPMCASEEGEAYQDLCDLVPCDVDGDVVRMAQQLNEGEDIFDMQRRRGDTLPAQVGEVRQAIAEAGRMDWLPAERVWCIDGGLRDTIYTAEAEANG
jgi:hypothetical protein